MIPCILLSFLFAFLSGVSRGFHHARRDYPTMNKSRGWVSEKLWWGGKENGFVQSSIFTADFTHQMILLQVAFLALSGMCLGFACIAGMQWWVIPIWGAVVFHRFEPRGFDLMYNVVLPNDPIVPQFTWTFWLRSWVY